jgi:uncharacterized damage-inducible protein DinB
MAKQESLEEQLAQTWRRHNGILLFLVDQIPPKGAEAVPSQSRGRNVAEQFAHVDRVRKTWSAYHATGTRPKMEKTIKGAPPSLAILRNRLQKSGDEVERYLWLVLRDEGKIRMFGGSPVRWMSYLIAHESHHHGQVLLALKQNGLRLPEAAAVKGIWGKWIMGT